MNDVAVACIRIAAVAANFEGGSHAKAVPFGFAAEWIVKADLAAAFSVVATRSLVFQEAAASAWISAVVAKVHGFAGADAVPSGFTAIGVGRADIAAAFGIVASDAAVGDVAVAGAWVAAVAAIHRGFVGAQRIPVVFAAERVK